MATCNSYYCNDLVAQVINTCGEQLAGGQDQMVVFQCGSEPTDPTDGTEIAAIIAAGNAVLFSNVKIDIPAASAQEVQSYIGGQPPRTATYTRTFNVMDANVNEDSDAAWEALNSATGQVIGAVLVNIVNGDGLSSYLAPSGGFVFKGGKVFPTDDTDFIHYEYSATCKNRTDWQMVATPTGIFS